MLFWLFILSAYVVGGLFPFTRILGAVGIGR